MYMLNSLSKKKRSFIFVSIIFIFALMFFPGFLQPTLAAETVWVEVKCTVPEGFSSNTFVLLEHLDSHEQYTITCREINGYIGRSELPIGSYSVVQAFTNAYDKPYFATAAPVSFELKAEAMAAQLIKVEVAEFTEPEVIGTDSLEEESSVEVEGTDTNAGFDDTESESVPEAEDVSEDAGVSDEMESSNNDPSEGSDVLDDDGSEPSVLSKILMIILGSAVFACIVFLLAAFYLRYCR